ncbi:MAG: hypothetical protein BGO77_01880 [Caedibacter sp. 37-49]|nr:MAG: hypothetical protein BGO77_01880 [Caedibacter sp. 37-49]
MKNILIRIKFCFIILLINTFLTHISSASHEEEDKGASLTFKRNHQDKVQPTQLSLKAEVRTLATEVALKKAIKKWHEESNSSSWSLFKWSRKSRFDFDTTHIEYVKSTKSLEDQQEELIAEHQKVDKYIADHHLDMLVYSYLNALLSNTSSMISYAFDDNHEKETFIAPNTSLPGELTLIEQTLPKAETLKDANPFFVEDLTLKGQTLTRESYKKIEPQVLRLIYLTGLTLEFNQFEAGVLKYILPRILHLKRVSLKGNLTSLHLNELSKIPPFLANLEELDLFSLPQEETPTYSQKLMDIFELVPNLKVLGLSFSHINQEIDLRIQNRLRNLVGMRFQNFQGTSQTLQEYVEGIQFAYDSKFKVDLPDNPILMRLLEHQLRTSRIFPVESA